MNKALIKHIVDSVRVDYTRSELIDHIFTILSRAETIESMLAKLYGARTKLHGVLERDRDHIWDLRYENIKVQIGRVKDTCHHVAHHGADLCIICGRVTARK